MSQQLNDDTEAIENDEAEDAHTDTTDSGEWTPPTKEQWEALVTKESKAAAEAASRKRWLREAGINPKTGEKVNPVQTDTDETRVNPEELRRHEQSGLKKGITIYGELVNAGVNPKRVEAVLKFLDMDEITFDEDGIEGLSTQIAELKEDYPEFFKRERMKTTDASVVGAGKKTASSSDTQTWEDMVRERFNKGLI
jgi:hypothetical protein